MAENALNAVEREPVETRVLNPNASEASYKPKQRSYKKTKLKKIIFFFSEEFGQGDFVGGILSWNPFGTPCIYFFQIFIQGNN